MDVATLDGRRARGSKITRFQGYDDDFHLNLHANTGNLSLSEEQVSTLCRKTSRSFSQHGNGP